MKTYTAEEKKQWIKSIANKLTGGEIIFLEGDLGAGKTTFVRELMGVMGFTDPVRSPTFTIINRYPVNWNGITQVLHLDLYRLEDVSELEALALEEELGQSNTIMFIEWPALIQERGILNTATVKFEMTQDGAYQLEWIDAPIVST